MSDLDVRPPTHSPKTGSPAAARPRAEAPAQAPQQTQQQAAQRASSLQPALPEAAQPDGEHDLAHHGDRDLAPGLVDLAVNVRLPAPPPWLAERIRASLTDLGRYPDVSAATAAIAAHHGVPEAWVLPTSGAAEAFSLIARARPWRRPLVVHPQFTEPEVALIAARNRPIRHVLSPRDGFQLDPERVDGAADLVIIGNPTNPTGVLHTRENLRQLRRAGRVLVVDEAFMDAVPGEPESLIGSNLHGIVVVRSLTKTWGLAGLRAGYVIGDPNIISDLRAAQSPWSVSTPAIAAMVACMSERAAAESRSAAQEIEHNRGALVAALATTSVRVVAGSRAPFLLVDTSPIISTTMREALAYKGFAVRRGETFPGLGQQWIRVAVRTPDVSAEFAAAITSLERIRRGT
jgi:histidinol-phosphate/aromatic aminotransferase/cobyric acid decarboxylase-like protein